MPSVGDGTGKSGGGPEEQGLTSNEGKSPNSVPKPYGQGSGGQGTEDQTPSKKG